MYQYKLSNAAKKAIESTIGLTIDQIHKLDYDDEIKYIENKLGKSLSFPENQYKIKTIEEVDKEIEKIISGIN